MPPACHTTKRSQVMSGRYNIRIPQPTMESSGSHGTPGQRNGRRLSGSVRRSTMTPAETMMKAKSVPMLVNSMASLMSTNIAGSPTATPVRMVVT